MREKNKYKILYLSRYIAEFLFYSVFPLYLKKLSYSGTQIGLILSLSPLLLVMALPFWSRFDSGSARKKVLIIAAVSTIALQIVLSVPMQFVFFALFAALYAIFKAPFYPSIDALATIYSMENKIEYSSLRAFGSLGYIIAVVVATSLIDRVSFVWLLSLSTALFLILILSTISLKPLQSDIIKGEDKSNLKLLFKNHYFIIFLIAQVFVFSTFMINCGFDLLYLDSRGVSPAFFGISTIGRVSIEIISFFILVKLKIPYKKMFVILPAFFLVQSILYFFTVNIYIILTITMLTGFPGGALFYLNNKYIARIVRIKNITKATYITAIVQNLFIAIFTFLSGIIIDHIGIRYIYLFTGCSFIFSIPFIAIFFKNVENKNIFS